MNTPPTDTGADAASAETAQEPIADVPHVRATDAHWMTAGFGWDVTTALRGTAWVPVPPAQVRAGEPATRYVDLDETDGRCVGVWEHSPGVSTDVESDEVFVVLAGSGTLEFEEPKLPAVDLHPGVVVRLTEGMRTVWTARDTLRKLSVS